MKILMLTPYLPFPLWSGGQIRTYNLMKNLSRKHEITLISFIRQDEEIKYLKELKKYAKEVYVYKKRPPWSLKSLSISALTPYPLVVSLYLKPKVKNKIADLINKEKFDLIHAETFYIMPNLPESNIPIILAEQTIEYMVYKHFTKSVKLPPVKFLMNIDVMKIKYWEKYYWRKSRRVVAMSEADRQVMRRMSGGSLAVDLVPNGVDTQLFKPFKNKKKGNRILFVGNFKWLQNREAAFILLSRIWPEILKKIPGASLWIVGKHPPLDIKKFHSDKIRISENVKDIRDAYGASDCLLAPIYGPGGTRYKILESMASGLPVVSTSRGIEGLGAKNRQHAYIEDSPKGMAQATVAVLKNKALYEKLAENGRKLVIDKFGWKSIAMNLDRIYKDAYEESKN